MFSTFLLADDFIPIIDENNPKSLDLFILNLFLDINKKIIVEKKKRNNFEKCIANEER